MPLSISNIAWGKEYDCEMYLYLKEIGITGLEVAPTRIFENNPYDHLDEANLFKKTVKANYNLNVCSMQSILYGKNENIFGTQSERIILINYIKKAILFAEVLGCNNLVFGAPKNRNVTTSNDYERSISFFSELGDYAYKHNTILSIEANPTIYNTNFINTTMQAIQLVETVNSRGFKVNLDLGTIIQNNENIDQLDFTYVNHVHISEPFLKEIEWSTIHNKLYEALKKSNYKNYISIEMAKGTNLTEVKKIISKFYEIFTQ